MQSEWIWGITQSSYLRWRKAKTVRQDSKSADWCSWGLNQAKKQSWWNHLGFWLLFFWNSVIKVLVQEKLLHFPTMLSIIYVHECIKWHADQCMDVTMYLELRIITLLILETEEGQEICYLLFFNEFTFDNYVYSLIWPPRRITKTRVGENKNGFLHFLHSVLRCFKIERIWSFLLLAVDTDFWGSLWHW